MTNIYDIITYPDSVLKETAHEITSITPAIQAQAERMLHTIYETNGIGIAANQVNILNRMFVLDVDPHCWEYEDKNASVLTIQSSHRGNEEGTSNPIVMINPKIVKKSDQRSVYMEGCLSLPQQYADVERPAHITVEYLDINGEKNEWSASGLESHAVQHELDHLDGVLFIDYLSRLKRGTLVRKLEKYKKSTGLL